MRVFGMEMGRRAYDAPADRVLVWMMYILSFVLGSSPLPEEAAPGASATLRDVTAMLLDMLLAEGWLRPLGS